MLPPLDKHVSKVSLYTQNSFGTVRKTSRCNPIQIYKHPTFIKNTENNKQNFYFKKIPPSENTGRIVGETNTQRGLFVTVSPRGVLHVSMFVY